MKILLGFILFFSSLLTIAQPNTDVFVMDVIPSEEGLKVSNFRNVSNNEGYDNQPSFYDTNTLVYAMTRNGATDIGATNLPSFQQYWLNLPTDGGEYSPVHIPGSTSLAAVRLDPDGLQRLYEYPIPDKPSKLLIQDLQVAYYAFYDGNHLLASVLSDNRLDLVMHDFQEKKTDTLLENSGRSIHKVPNRNSMSYTAVNDEGNQDIYLLDMKDRESYFVCQLPIGIQDYAWLNEDEILIGSNDKLFMYDTADNAKWKQVADLSGYKIKDITRLAVSPNGRQLALAAESLVPPPGAVVQAHIAPFNNGDLDAFVNCFSEDVKVAQFPNKVNTSGRDQLKESYRQFYERNKEYHVEVVERIIIGRTVIDKERAMVNGKTDFQVTVYTVNNGKINSMTFIPNRKTSEKAEEVVQKQLDAYNNRDIDAFMATYTEDVGLFNYPEDPRSQGQVDMRKGYASFFESTPDLNCEIKTRIVIGNKVIDEEFLTMNGQNFKAVAIYEVNNGLISKVTFIR